MIGNAKSKSERYMYDRTGSFTAANGAVRCTLSFTPNGAANWESLGRLFARTFGGSLQWKSLTYSGHDANIRTTLVLPRLPASWRPTYPATACLIASPTPPSLRARLLLRLLPRRYHLRLRCTHSGLGVHHSLAACLWPCAQNTTMEYKLVWCRVLLTELRASRCLYLFMMNAHA